MVYKLVNMETNALVYRRNIYRVSSSVSKNRVILFIKACILYTYRVFTKVGSNQNIQGVIKNILYMGLSERIAAILYLNDELKCTILVLSLL